MIGLALALALAGQDQYPGRVVALPAPWDHLEIGEWTYEATASDGSLVMLTRPARARGQIWVRYEYASDSNGEVMSERDLVEVNCAEWKTRKLQVDLFSESNLNGYPRSTTIPDAWAVAAPDTVAELQLEAACGD